MRVDLRSDTVTHPTDAMRAAMASAEVGDDLSGEDPTVNRLQSLAASLLGKEAALYLPTGTMCNQIAIRLLAPPGTEVACGARAHVYAYEDAGAARNSGVQMHPLADWSDLDRVLAGVHHHLPRVALVAIENTVMAESGRPLEVAEVHAIADVARAHDVPLYCDGARIWNAAIATGTAPRELVAPCDAVMFCLSKGLSAPIGSLLCGTRDFIERARAEKHRVGGGWRQAGIVAAAGIVALETMVERLADDHARAHAFADALHARWPGALDPATIRTNIVCADLRALPEGFLASLRSSDVLGDSIDPYTARFVFHAGIDDAQLDHALTAVTSLT